MTTLSDHNDSPLRHKIRNLWHDNFDESEFIEEAEALINQVSEERVRGARTDEHLLVYRKVRNLSPDEFHRWSDERIASLNKPRAAGLQTNGDLVGGVK